MTRWSCWTFKTASQQCAEKKWLVIIMIFGHDSSVHRDFYLGGDSKDDFYATSEEVNGAIKSLVGNEPHVLFPNDLSRAVCGRP